MDAADALAALIALIDRANVVDSRALDRIKSSPELAQARSLLAGSD